MSVMRGEGIIISHICRTRREPSWLSIHELVSSSKGYFLSEKRGFLLACSLRIGALVPTYPHNEMRNHNSIVRSIKMIIFWLFLP